MHSNYQRFGNFKYFKDLIKDEINHIYAALYELYYINIYHIICREIQLQLIIAAVHD